MPERYHPGEDREAPDLREVNAEPDRGDVIFSGNFETDEPGEEPETLTAEAASCRFCQNQFETRDDRLAHHCRQMRQWRSRTSWDAGDDEVIEPGIHEIGAHLLFASDDYEMRPYFAIVSQFDHCLQDTFENEKGATVSTGDDIGEFEAAGETWQLNHENENVKYWQGAIATRRGDSGEAYYEYNIGVVAQDDVRRKRVNFQFRPSLPDATHYETEQPIQSMPDDLPLGIRVQIDSANVSRDQLVDVLHGLASAMDINTDYFRREDLHDWSRLYNMAYYVRVLRESVHENVVNRTGLMQRMADFGSGHRGRGELKWDNEEIEGHRTAISMNEHNLSKLFTGHHVGKLLKSYYRKDPGPDDPERPTTQPKIETQFSTKYSEHSAVAWESAEEYDADDLERELDEFLVNTLDWAGITLDPSDDVYVDDQYWTAEASNRDLQLHQDPMHELRVAEEEIALYHIVESDSSPAQRQVLATIADGGSMHHEKLAKESGTSNSTVWRAMQKYSDVLESVNGKIHMADDVIRSKFEDLFGQLESAAEWVENGVEALRDSESILSEDTPFAKWARRYGVQLQEHRDRFDINFKTGTFERYEIRKILRAGYQAARDTGINTALKLREASMVYRDADAGRTVIEQPFTADSTHIRALGLRAATLG